MAAALAPAVSRRPSRPARPRTPRATLRGVGGPGVDGHAVGAAAFMLEVR